MCVYPRIMHCFCHCCTGNLGSLLWIVCAGCGCHPHGTGALIAYSFGRACGRGCRRCVVLRVSCRAASWCFSSPAALHSVLPSTVRWPSNYLSRSVTLPPHYNSTCLYKPSDWSGERGSGVCREVLDVDFAIRSQDICAEAPHAASILGLAGGDAQGVL
jgi:hypothetical protein